MRLSSPIYVLVVEDEFLSRLHAVNLVEDAGYEAIEASSAKEAIAILEARKDIPSIEGFHLRISIERWGRLEARPKQAPQSPKRRLHKATA